jgi:hypothetical protein
LEFFSVIGNEDAILRESPETIFSTGYGRSISDRITFYEDFETIWIERVYLYFFDIILILFEIRCYDGFIEEEYIFLIDILDRSIGNIDIDPFIDTFYEYL